VANTEYHRDKPSSALTLEQELHIEAANRQLETLVEMEQQLGDSSTNGFHQVDETHIV
jgi:hypothetical protein